MSHCQIFTDAEVDSLRHGGKILRDTLNYCASIVREGMTTAELDAHAEKFIRDHEGAVPGFKGYQGYVATLCTSVNEECVHGIPGTRVLEAGDIVSIDCGVLYDELNTDACLTVGIGEISEDAQNLLDVTEAALKEALAMMKEGVQTGDISYTIQSFVEERGMKAVRSLTGHGLGKTLHQFPDIPNVGRAGTGPALPSKTLVAIEPIVSLGSDTVKQAKDGWTLSTRDDALSAHFEHSVLIHENGVEIIA